MGVIRRSRPYAPRENNFVCAAPRSALAERASRFGVAAPIDRKRSGTHVAMKRGVRPIAHPRDQSMLERIDGAILDMTHIIGFIANLMLPEPGLPDAAFAAAAPVD